MKRLKQILHTLRTDREARFYLLCAIALVLFFSWLGATGHWDNDPLLPHFLR